MTTINFNIVSEDRDVAHTMSADTTFTTDGTAQTDVPDGESEMEFDAPEADYVRRGVGKQYVPRTLAKLVDTLCFETHQFTTMDLILHGLRSVAILLFASILMPYNLFHIYPYLFVLIITLSLIYIIGKTTFKADKVAARVDRNRLAKFRARFGSELRDRVAKPVARARTVHSAVR